MSIYKKERLKSWFDKWVLAILLLLLLCGQTAFSQDDRRNRRIRNKDISAVSLSDSLKSGIRNTDIQKDSIPAVSDTISRNDSVSRADSVDLLKKSSLDAPAFTAARDSIVEDFSNGKRMIYYYGDASVTYCNLKLTAD